MTSCFTILGLINLLQALQTLQVSGAKLFPWTVHNCILAGPPLPPGCGSTGGGSEGVLERRSLSLSGAADNGGFSADL